jgi:hypothetical protein
LHRWKLGLPLTEPAYRKRRRRALAAERKARRRESNMTAGRSQPSIAAGRSQPSVTAGRSQSERGERRTNLPLDIGPALIVILLLSLGLWAMIWAVVALTLRALG